MAKLEIIRTACNTENQSVPTADDLVDNVTWVASHYLWNISTHVNLSVSMPPVEAAPAAPTRARQQHSLGVQAPGGRFPLRQRTTRPRSFMRCGVLLNIFTTFIDQPKDARKVHAQMAVLESYARLQPLGVQAWLFTESDVWAARAKQHKVEKAHAQKHLLISAVLHACI